MKSCPTGFSPFGSPAIQPVLLSGAKFGTASCALNVCADSPTIGAAAASSIAPMLRGRRDLICISVDRKTVEQACAVAARPRFGHALHTGKIAVRCVVAGIIFHPDVVALAVDESSLPIARVQKLHYAPQHKRLPLTNGAFDILLSHVQWNARRLLQR